MLLQLTLVGGEPNTQEKRPNVLIPLDEQQRRENFMAAQAYLAGLYATVIDDDAPLRYEPPVLVGKPSAEPHIHKPVRCNALPRRTRYHRWGR